MRTGGRQRYVWLFLLAIVVPSIALAWIGARLIQQDRELGESRRVDEQRRVVSEVRRGLLEYLDGLKGREVSSMIARGFSPSSDPGNPAVVLSGLVIDGELLMPWETALPARGGVQDSDNPRYREAVTAGSVAEFSLEDHAVAARLYDQALAAARDQGQETRARFLLARALAKVDGDPASLTPYRTIMESDIRTTDEFGVPYALYAARQLLRAGVTDTLMATLIEAELAPGLRVAPNELYLLSELASTLAEGAEDRELRARAGSLLRSIESRSSLAEQALSLQRAFPRLDLLPPPAGDGRSPESSWVSWGNTWLVSGSLVPGEIQGVVVVVRANDAIRAVEGDILASGAGELFEVLTTPDSASPSLSPHFPGLSVRFEPQPSVAGDQDLRRSFMLAALMLVLSVTLLGGYLLWRDIRRELNTVQLRSDFVSAVSHELKTPVTSIRMFAETLQMHETTSVEKRAEYLDTIVCESERLSRLLDNVLEFSKIERGAKQYRPAPNSLAEIIRVSARTMRYPYEREGFSLHVDIDEDIPDLNVDRDAIEQAILNLLTNAMKYSDTERGVTLGLHRVIGYAVIEVKDEGIGIAPDEQRHIFEQFYRVRDANGDAASGTGLGLTLVQHIAEAHGGHITVKSEPTQGSTFSLHLPLEANPA